ncbi:MAG: enolase C-terminal domain-like protein [SAR324 cluster bacterium]|jgi:L-alanine-DL-glutamate epimerase-like enolase superfamily enzyme|nr:enolase C-terminal domain-like protein [SAR324 cluster bacterium]MDP6639237.1 enolase C-terminal domain-like protein [SAR324 cluster bacterium]MDP7332081.1 enolase C-terminal domain-like protein [SAR324 cluster bacterium]MDP7502029.1 enolase C-terminal domain-like protein [SAR324 cluster bacterium]|tara:strand:+ start:726 stop:1919 length:1194 start_codon:yes stop_codon:yes gene_type:complete
MPIIQEVRCILLSSPYADIEDPEIKECFPNGPKRTIGMVEVTLDNGFKGLGEGYLAVFAPKVFKSIVDLCTPYLINTDAFDLKQRVRDLCRICDYWSLQGAARHVTSAFEIALADAQAKSMGVPVHNLYGEAKENSIRMYGSGGCCDQKEHFIRELEMLEGLGINLYKIRAVKEDIRRTAWILEEAGQRGIEVGVDMCQNLTDPPQKVKDVADYVDSVYKLTDYKILFLEEAIGPANPEGFKSLRETVSPKICGGEIITTPREMIDRINHDVYDFVQPDASVIGGIGAVMEVFSTAKQKETDVVVHAWGGPVAIMASYHAAFAGGGNLVEYPMLAFLLGDEILGESLSIKNGFLKRPDGPGLGGNLTEDIEMRYPFDESAVYSCKTLEWTKSPESYW